MELWGYARRILYVDLTNGNIKQEPLDVEMTRAYLGGAGINIKLAYDLIPPGVKPLSPENTIIIGTGLFSGTMIPGASQVMVIYKSPLNGAFICGYGGGRFSHFLKSSGYDHVVITGRSEQPVYLKIGESIELCDAGDLWGMDSFKTVDETRRRHEPCSVIPIGPSGENLVNISVTHIDKGGTLGSGGLAAVMGSKKLKAIVVTQGTRSIDVADRHRLLRLVDHILDGMKDLPLRNEIVQTGRMSWSSRRMEEGVITKNSSAIEPYPPDIEDVKAAVYELHKRSRRRIACATCPMADKDRIDMPEYGLVTYDTGIMARMAIMTASSAFAYSDRDTPSDRYMDALRYHDLMNRYGIDRTYSFEGLIDFVTTLYEERIITKEDTGGIELNRRLETVLELVKMTALRKGFGDILADGVLGAARKIGRNAGKYVQNVVKGQFILFDPRLRQLGPMQFEQLVYPGRPLSHGGMMGSATNSPNSPIYQIVEEAEHCGVPQEAMDRIFTSNSFNVGRLTRHGEDYFGLFNMLGLCHMSYISRFYNMKTLAELYSVVTGIDASPDDLKLASERVWNLWRVLNYRAGFNRRDDEPPGIWFQPLKGVDREHYLEDYYGTDRLTKEDVAGYLDDYYGERGWDKEAGIPTRQKLAQLGFKSIVQDVEGNYQRKGMT